jgi:chitodextrinase
MNAKCTVVLCGLLALGLASGVAQANVISWGGGTGTWNTAANWTGGILPTTGDTAVIGSGRPQVNVTLSPAPDVIRVDSGGTACFTGASITNDFVLNGGKFDMGGDSNPTMSGNVLLTADSTIQNTRGNSNRAFKVNGTISEDASPRKLSLSGYPTTGGALMDSTQIGGTNSYSGGTDVTGASNYLKSLGALGSGPVTVSAGRLCFNVAGDYSHGQVTVTGGTVIVGATGISNEVWGFQGGTLTYDQSPRTLDVTNQVTISNTVEVLAGGGYYNNPLTIATSITGDGKAVLNNTGSPSQSVLQISAAQLWTGGTDVKGIVVILSGGSLPAGTVTVYPVSYSYGTGLLRLSVASALNSATDLVLQYDSINDRYGTIMLGANQVVHSLTLDGAVIPAGFYTQADFPNYLVGSGTYTLRVLSPDTGPNAITDLAGTSPDWFKVNLTWTAPADNIDPAATSYDIRYSTSTIDDTNWDTATQLSGEPTPAAPGQPESFQVTGLLGGTTYYFALKSSDSGANWSALSNVAVVTTMATDAVAPGAVSDLAAADVKSNFIRLTWTATGDDGSTGQASSYDLRYSTSAISDDTSFSAATPVTGLSAPKAAGQGETFTVTGLTPSTLYYFAIKVADEVPNWSALSNVVSVSTQEADLLPPLAVTDLRVLGVETRAVVLAWTAPADQGPGACASYDLRYSSSPISDDTAFDAATTVSGLPVPATPGTTEQFTVSGLTPDTTYYFAIKTADTAMPANVSALSNSPSGKTRPPVVPVVVHNPWVVNDRVADTHNLATMGATYVNAYTPDGVVAPASDENKAINIYDNQKRRPASAATTSTTRRTTRTCSAGACAAGTPLRPARSRRPPGSPSG